MYANKAYVDTQAVSADPLELVRMMYRGALEAVSGARIHLHQGDIQQRAQKLSKAGGILNELALSVNHDAGTDLSRSLVELYDYLQRLIVKANFEQRDEPLAEAEALLATMLEGWESCRPAEPFPVLSGEPEYVGIACSY